MAKIEFKGKVQIMHDQDGEVDYRFIRIPEFDRKHCDMSAFRCHPKYGSYANSNLFKAILGRIRKDVSVQAGISNFMRFLKMLLSIRPAFWRSSRWTYRRTS